MKNNNCEDIQNFLVREVVNKNFELYRRRFCKRNKRVIKSGIKKYQKKVE